MARADFNELLKGFSGRIGHGFVVKQYKDKIVITAMPKFNPKQKKSASQKKYAARFKQAVKYAQGILADPEKKAAMAKKLPPGKLVYHAAIREYMNKG